MCGNLKGEEEGFPIKALRFTGSSKMPWWEQECGRASTRKCCAQKQRGKTHMPVMVKEMMPEKNRICFPLFSSTPRCSKES